MIEREISELLDLDEAELLLGLGRSLQDGRLGISPADYAKRATAWLDAHRAEVCRCLSAIPGMRQLIEDQWAARRLETLGACCDFLALMYGKATAWWAMMFILRSGLADFCAGCEPPTPTPTPTPADAGTPQ